MKTFLNGLGSMFSWIFKRLPSKPESLRLEKDRLEREWNEIVKARPSAKNATRLQYISKRLREIYEAQSARD